MRRSIIFLLDLPKPVHGLSVVNKSMLKLAANELEDFAVINTAPSYAAKSFGKFFWQFIKIFHTLFCMVKLLGVLFSSRSKVVYRAVNGGFGQIYDVLFFALCHIFRSRIIVHHHSFAYLNKYSFIFSFLVRVAGNNCRHVVLGQEMLELLHKKYKVPKENIIVLSNAVFYEPSVADEVISKENCERPLVVGHLANLCVAKGVDEFVALCRELSERKIHFHAKIAGPFVDSESRKLVDEACFELSEVSYVGPLYGSEKDEFFSSLDVFVFPSKYVNEAEPLVLYEASMGGAYCIGTRQGCMESVISSLQGATFDYSKNLCREMAIEIERLSESGGLSDAARRYRVSAFSKVCSKSKNSLDLLFELMKNVEIPKSRVV